MSKKKDKSIQLKIPKIRSIKDVYNDISTSINKATQQLKIVSINHTKTVSSKVTEQLDTFFIHHTLINYIVTSTFIKYIYRFDYNKIAIVLTVYSKMNVSKKKIETLINIICIMLTIPSYISIDKLNISLILTPFKKKLKKTKKHIGSDSVNSGYCYSTKNTSSILIYRLEELEKVLIHELVHALHIDYGQDISIPFHKLFQIQSRYGYNINEAYTEVWTVVILCAIQSYRLEMKKNYMLFIKLLRQEQLFSLVQVGKILYYFGFKTSDDFTKPFNPKYPKMFSQSTYVFSYYYVKASALYHISNYLQFIYNGTNIEKKKEVDYLKKMYLNVIQDRDFLDQINKIIEAYKIQKHIKIKGLNRILDDTSMRMTLHG